jgi:hypothetical protein
MAEAVSVKASSLDPSVKTVLNDAIRGAWEAAHHATGGDVALMTTVCCELLARPIAAMQSAGEEINLQALMGHVYSRAQQIIAQHNGPIISTLTKQ